ncbi:MAG: DUF4267 domain-containing protein [Armatimonadetes bacterium]|nr:DUF4267 domain-containing protein [Anaerolineae bacterium]
MSALTPAPFEASTPRPVWRSVGIWMVGVLVGYILFNAVRAVANPVDFAAYFGIPLSNPENTGFVFVYAIRALFLGLFGFGLIVRQQYSALALYALIGSIMPLGDAVLVAFESGTPATIIRHLLVAVFLLLTWWFMRRWVLSTAQTAR